MTNDGPLLLGIQSDLVQLQAVGKIEPARAALATATQQAQEVTALAASASQRVTAARAAHGQAIADLAVANRRLATLAVAAYTGETDVAPVIDAAAASPPPLPGLSGPASAATDSTPLLDPTQEFADAGVLLDAVVAQAEVSLATEKHRVTAAGKAITAAQQDANHASQDEAQAAQLQQAAQQVLNGTLAAATTPGVAPPALGGTPVASPPVTVPAGRAKPPSPADPSLPSPTVLGPPTLSADELAGWFNSTTHQAHTTVSIAQLATDYLTAAQQTGVRGDIAFAQSIVETGFFSFPSYGQVATSDNNFAGIGACDSCAHGWSFPNAQTGVSAQLQLLDAYASPTLVPTPLVGPVGVGGCCGMWMSLAGTWATNPNYGRAILTVYKQMLDWALPRRLGAAGLGPGGG